MPRIERQPPPYAQITDHYRRMIIDGTLTEGAPVPSVTKVAKEWKVAHATAARAMSQLQVEGLITSSTKGSFVAARDARASSPQDRISRSHRIGTTDAADEKHTLRAAAVVPAPAYVAELFDVPPGSEVVRREWTTGEDIDHPRSLTVTWHPAAFVPQVPDLLDMDPSKVGTLLSRIEAVAGKAKRARDFYHGRGADARESTALKLPVGAAILAMTWLVWSEEAGEDRLIEYGESCIPPRHTVSYPYDISPDGE